MRDLTGMIEGDKVTLRSVDRRPGDSITYIFLGDAVGGNAVGADSSRRVPDGEVHRQASCLLDDAEPDTRAGRAADCHITPKSVDKTSDT